MQSHKRSKDGDIYRSAEAFIRCQDLYGLKWLLGHDSVVMIPATPYSVYPTWNYPSSDSIPASDLQLIHIDSVKANDNKSIVYHLAKSGQIKDALWLVDNFDAEIINMMNGLWDGNCLKDETNIANTFSVFNPQERETLTRAINYFNKRIEGQVNAEEKARLHLCCGFLYVKKNQLAEALASFAYAYMSNKKLTLNPAANLLCDVGNEYCGKSNLKMAEMCYSAAINLDSTLARAYRNRGHLRRNNKELHDAILDFNSAIEHKPDYARAYLDRSYVFCQFHCIEQALEDYDRAVEYKIDEVVVDKEYKKHIEFYKLAQIQEGKGELIDALYKYNGASDFSAPRIFPEKLIGKLIQSNLTIADDVAGGIIGFKESMVLSISAINQSELKHEALISALTPNTFLGSWMHKSRLQSPASIASGNLKEIFELLVKEIAKGKIKLGDNRLKALDCYSALFETCKKLRVHTYAFFSTETELTEFKSDPQPQQSASSFTPSQNSR